jgi:hypothetical protein
MQNAGTWSSQPRPVQQGSPPPWTHVSPPARHGTHAPLLHTVEWSGQSSLVWHPSVVVVVVMTVVVVVGSSQTQPAHSVASHPEEPEPPQMSWQSEWNAAQVSPPLASAQPRSHMVIPSSHVQVRLTQATAAVVVVVDEVTVVVEVSHTPPAHIPPSSQAVPSGSAASGGQSALVPVQLSAASQSPSD